MFAVLYVGAVLRGSARENQLASGALHFAPLRLPLLTVPFAGRLTFVTGFFAFFARFFMLVPLYLGRRLDAAIALRTTAFVERTGEALARRIMLGLA